MACCWFPHGIRPSLFWFSFIIFVSCLFFLRHVFFSIGQTDNSTSMFFNLFARGSFAFVAWYIANFSINFVYWRFVQPKMEKPVMGDNFMLAPPSKPVDRWLVFGSCVFGLGWALGGSGPGGAIIAMISGNASYTLFAYGLYFSLVSKHYYTHGPRQEGWFVTVALGTIPAFWYFLAPLLFRPSSMIHNAWPVRFAIYGGAISGINMVVFAHLLGRMLGFTR